ncbi:hypothetical protein BTA51_22780 [Hahella sp. CCB-MM4]|uniref:hypothetical protein n=1 Tax=Hahella sp. (strain CCB-MM4) TaxID=1926491 RepID=UPI000B9ADD19|nr:hypothetical protein [Hahella sp. CCB-MM4]OZG70936.1 hypothetical protein BTA51_22780 [Hahella sp. CCB-MM4]
MSKELTELTMEEMLNECIRVRAEYRQETLDKLDRLLSAIRKGRPAPTQNDEALWVLHEDGRTVKYLKSR